jgi:hypothetical protein
MLLCVGVGRVDSNQVDSSDSSCWVGPGFRPLVVSPFLTERSPKQSKGWCRGVFIARKLVSYHGGIAVNSSIPKQQP